MATEHIPDEVLDELARRFWSFDHHSFDHRAFARECERMTREALGTAGVGGPEHG